MLTHPVDRSIGNTVRTVIGKISISQLRSNMSEIDTNSDGEEYSSGDTEGSGVGSSSGSCSYESTGSDSGSRSNDSEAESEEEEEIEPVLKYKRFARDVVASISQAHGGHESNVICCMAVHSKVSIAVHYLELRFPCSVHY